MFDLESCVECINADTDTLHITLSCVVYTLDAVDVVVEFTLLLRTNLTQLLTNVKLLSIQIRQNVQEYVMKLLSRSSKNVMSVSTL